MFYSYEKKLKVNSVGSRSGTHFRFFDFIWVICSSALDRRSGYSVLRRSRKRV